MERTPFNKNYTLRAYLNKGGDLNISKNGVSLIEHMLTQRYDDVTKYYSVTKLVAHPECIVDKDNKKIQTLLYFSFSNFQFGAIKKEEQESGFINKFNLKNNIFINPNIIPGKRETSYSIGWLQFFLIDNHTFQLFDWAKKYSDEYSDGLKATDQIGYNIWHTLFSAVANLQNTDAIFNAVCEKVKTLLNDYPEGLNQKNNAGETPYEFLNRLNNEPEYVNKSNIKKILSYCQYLELQSEIEIQNSSSKKLKL
jgi:hypothetical protein